MAKRRKGLRLQTGRRTKSPLTLYLRSIRVYPALVHTPVMKGAKPRTVTVGNKRYLDRGRGWRFLGLVT